MLNLIKDTKDLTLLYVEDDKNTIETSLLIFENFFQNIIIAYNGKKALDEFKNNKIDIVITDINMPEMNGIELIRRIKELKKNIPVIVMSAYSEAEYFLETIKLGIEGYLLKPVNIDEFMEVLKKISDNLKIKKERAQYFNLFRQYQEAIDEIASISKTDSEGIITYVNDSYCKISGYKKEELIGKNHNIIKHPGNSKEFYKEMWDTIKNKKQVWKGIVRNITKDGKNYYAKTVIKPILDDKGNIMEFIALRDNITNLMNHKKQLQDFIKVTKHPLVILIKIEIFEDMELFYGQNSTEEIEKTFADKIMSVLPLDFDFDKVFILGNGEFALARDLKENSLSEFIKKINIFQKVLNNSYINFKGINYCLSGQISVGYGNSAFEKAKHGMRMLKGKKRLLIVSNNLIEKKQKEAQKNLKILKTIRDSIKNSRVISYFQPIIDNKTLKIHKYESLMRILDENNKILTPFIFLNIAKKTNYYPKLTLISFKNTIKALRKTNINMSVNISSFDIENENTRNNILNILNDNKDIASKITLELLEDEEINDFQLIKNFVKTIKSFGAKMAIDDFGKGYSNFERVIQYEPDILKLDGLLIKDIENNNLSLSIVESLILFAKKQNMKVIAEYVENENIFNMLKKLNVDYSQGYYFGKPEIL